MNVLLAMDIPTATTLVCAFIVIAIMALSLRGSTISNWYKNECHKTSGKSSHSTDHSDSPDMHDKHIVDFKTDVDARSRRKRG